ncbi:MAG: efflux RND transporter periplasmic adaptor subunit [Pseudomonadota bacterium]|nr:efflux RND transporter periplasmic adaptor subunit [Pseudomonadota bacterium]
MNKHLPTSVPIAGLYFFFFGVAALVLSGCSEQEAPVVIDTARPVKSVIVGGPEAGGERRFPGRVDSSSKAELAFRIPGTIAEMHVREGDVVEEGQVLVELDPTDYEIVLKDRQATYDRNKKDYERAQELVKDGFISKTDFDKKEAEFKNAEASLNAAEQDMKYTKLTAPFGGTVAQRYGEMAEEVQAKQPVLAIQDEQQLEVKVDVPENIMSRIDRAGARDRTPVWATFDTAPDRRIDLRFKEASTRADAATQTFEVTFLLDPPDGMNVLPGMTATVTADMSGMASEDAKHYLPVSAVTADAGLDPFVWLVKEDMTVAKTPVVVGRMSGWNIEVDSGVEPGMRLVSAGVGYLAEGMKVRLMEQPEQAEPRPEEAPYPIVPEVEKEIEKEIEKAEEAADDAAPAPVPAPSES